jgi:hypothetical protein
VLLVGRLTGRHWVVTGIIAKSNQQFALMDKNGRPEIAKKDF